MSFPAALRGETQMPMGCLEPAARQWGPRRDLPVDSPGSVFFGGTMQLHSNRLQALLIREGKGLAKVTQPAPL